MNIKPITIFSRTPSPSETIEKDSENRRISYWLKKLHEQRENSNTKRRDLNKVKHETVDSSQPAEENKAKSPETKGLEQNTTNQKVKEESDKHVVEELVKKSNRRIITISSTFPWTIFPNTIDVEESRVSFNFRQFMTYQSHSVDIKDVTNVFIESGIFFATLQLVSRTFIQNDIKIGYLRKNKAVQVRRVIEGLRTFADNNIDTSSYEIGELIKKLEELNTTNHIKNPESTTEDKT